MKKFSYCVLLVIAIGFGLNDVDAQVTINASRDAGFFAAGFNEGIPSFTSRNLGAHTHVPVAQANNDRVNRSVFDFDIAGNIPSGAMITSASFEFIVTQQGGMQGMSSVDFSLHRVTTDWDEGSGTGDTGEDVTDGVTWINATETTLWTTPGGDFDAATSGTVLVNGINLYSISSAKLITDIQNIVDGTATDYGFLLKGDPEGLFGSAARVTSREAGVGNEAKLIIEFTSGKVLLGDVNLDEEVNLLDVDPFVDRISTGTFQAEADANEDGEVDLLDVQPFVDILTGA